MATGFSRKQGRISARLDAAERAFLFTLLDQTRQLLAPAQSRPPADDFEALMRGAGVVERVEDHLRGSESFDAVQPGGQHGDSNIEANSPDTTDPALIRLLPPGHRDDTGIASEFRRLTEDGLRQRKSTRLSLAIDALNASEPGEEVILTDEQAEAVLVSLTDVRLILGERLDLHDDSDAEQLHVRVPQMSTDDPMLGLAVAYDFLTWLQETLAETLLP